MPQEPFQHGRANLHKNYEHFKYAEMTFCQRWLENS